MAQRPLASLSGRSWARVCIIACAQRIASSEPEVIRNLLAPPPLCQAAREQLSWEKYGADRHKSARTAPIRNLPEHFRFALSTPGAMTSSHTSPLSTNDIDPLGACCGLDAKNFRHDGFSPFFFIIIHPYVKRKFRATGIRRERRRDGISARRASFWEDVRTHAGAQDQQIARSTQRCRPHRRLSARA